MKGDIPFPTAEQAIRQLVKNLEDAWNASDSSVFCAPFADDADFVDILGEHHQGRAIIEAGHRMIFDTIYRGSRIRYVLERLRIVQPDLIIAFVRATLMSRLGGAVDDPNRMTRQGRTMSEAHARPTLILSNVGGEWKIVAFQNTRIAAAPVTSAI